MLQMTLTWTKLAVVSALLCLCASVPTYARVHAQVDVDMGTEDSYDASSIVLDETFVPLFDYGQNVTLQVVTATRSDGLYDDESTAPIVFAVHGFPEGWYAWLEMAEEFFAIDGTQNATFVMLNMRGYNESTVFPDQSSYAIQYLVGDLDALIELYTADRGDDTTVVLLAHDWGGAVSWAYAFVFPSAIDGLMILNMPHPDCFNQILATDPQQQEDSAYMVLFQSPSSTFLLEADDCLMLQKIFSNETWWDDTQQANYLQSWLQEGVVNAMLNYYRENVEAPVQSRIHVNSITNATMYIPDLPVSVGWGMQDVAFDSKPQLDCLPQYVTNLQVTRYPQNDHWVAQGNPSDMANQLYDFLVQLGGFGGAYSFSTQY